MAQVLIAGCGYVGSALAVVLRDGGHGVLGLKRSAGGMPDGVTALAADLAEPASLGAALAGVATPIDVLVYAAAADAADDASYARAYPNGIGHCLAALRVRGDALRHVVFTSSTSVYGQDDGSVVDESSPTEPAGFRGRRMLEAERVLAASGFPSTSLRLGGIYGPGRGRMIETVRAGRAAIRPGPHFGNRIHRDDAAGALAHLVALALGGSAPPPILLGVDDEPADEAVVLRWIAEQLGVPAPPNGAGARHATGKRCSNARLRATGYRFRYPTFREGYAAIIARGS